MPAVTENARPQVIGGKPHRGHLRRRAFVFAFGASLLALAIGGGYVYFDHAAHFVSTDDAFIASRQIAIAPKVSGYISQVLVTDNQHVAQGAVIARIDDRDFRVALEQAEAQVAAAQASINNITAQLAVQQAQVAASEAQVDQAQAALVFAEQQAVRYDELARKGAGTVQNAQQYGSQLQQQKAAVKTAQAVRDVAERKVEALNAQLASAPGEPRTGNCAARPGRTQFVLHYRDRRAGRARRQPHGIRRRICAGRHQSHDVRSG